MMRERSFRCRECDRIIILALDPSDLELFQAGMAIQRAMPYLTIEEQQLLLTGSCGECVERFRDKESA